MKLWFPLTLVCCLLLCLSMFLSLTQAVLNQPLRTVGLGPRLDRGGKAVSDAPTSSLVRGMEFDPARVGSLVPDRALSAAILVHPAGRPTGHQNRWGLRELPIKPALKPPPSSTFSTKSLAFNRRIDRTGVLQQPLARGAMGVR
jgi:hypothetical protein